jgi:hypothetical protein
VGMLPYIMINVTLIMILLFTIRATVAQRWARNEEVQSQIALACATEQTAELRPQASISGYTRSSSLSSEPVFLG